MLHRIRLATSCLVLAVAASCPAAALAQMQPATSSAGVQVRGVFAFGVMGGGEKLATYQVSSGGSTSTQSVRAGGTADFRGGVDVKLNAAWSMQATIGYATGGPRADNGKVTFTSVPLELLGHYEFAPAWRVGGGLRVPTGAKYQEGGVAGNLSVAFNASPAPVLEVEWLAGRSFGVKLRGMKESYKVKATGDSVDGNNVGLVFSMYF